MLNNTQINLINIVKLHKINTEIRLKTNIYIFNY